MRYAVAALALAGAAMAGEGYGYDSSKDSSHKDASNKDANGKPYPTYTNNWGKDYPTDYPSDYKTKSSDPYPYDPAYPASSYDPAYPTYDPAYPTYPAGYPTSTKKDDSYPTTTCTDDSDKYPYTKTYDHDITYTTSTIYQTKYHTITKGSEYETKTEEYAVTTTVYPVHKGESKEKESKEKYPEGGKKEEGKKYPEKEAPASKYPYKETATKKYEAACPTYSVKTLTTMVPSVYYETVSVPCSTYKPIPTGGSKPNGTYPKQPVVTAGASSFAFSGVFAAVAGLAAVAFL